MSVNIHFLPLRQGEYLKGEGVDKVFREMTKCHFVPHEWSTTQCDAGPTRRGRGWIGSGGGEWFLSTPSASLVAPVSGGQSG